jgi:hypothetical protein
VFRARPLPEAISIVILGGLLFLPSNFALKIAMVPAFDKNSVPNFCALVGCILVAKRRKVARSRFGIIEILLIMYLIGPVITSIANNDSLIFGDRIVPGVGYYDGISAFLSQLIIFVPFLVGRRFFQKESENEAILRVLVIAGFIYSFLMLFEIRMSPQLSNWIYGFFPSNMNTEVRYGGFRPVVFMKNGLAAAFFMTTTFLASLVFWRAKMPILPLPLPAGISAYFGIVIILCKSAGALVYAVTAGLAIRWLTPKVQLGLAVLLVSIGLVYPVLRAFNSFPNELLIEVANSFSEERADSLKTRFDQERLLIERASQRMVFGWGRYGRNRIYEDDTGKDVSITDGAWIQTLGQFGMVGFLAQFGLLSLPVFRAFTVRRSVRSGPNALFLAALALIVALNLIEQLPNSSISSWNWLLAGALLGRTEYLKRSRTGEEQSPAVLNQRFDRASSRRPSSLGA